MAKTTKADFDVFKKECQRLIKAFGLGGWNVYFRHHGDDSAYALCATKLTGKVATLFFSKVWSSDNVRPKTAREIKKTARHEVLHLVLSRMSGIGRFRWGSEEEMDEAEEEAVNVISNYLEEYATEV